MWLPNQEGNMLLMRNTFKSKLRLTEFISKDQESIKAWRAINLSWLSPKEKLIIQSYKPLLSIMIQFKIHLKRNSNFSNPNGTLNNKCLKLKKKKSKSKSWFKSKKRKKKSSSEMTNFSSIKTLILQLKLLQVHHKNSDF